MTTPESYLEGRADRSLSELKELLSFSSISSLPEHGADVREAANWVARRLTGAGIEHVEILETGGHPVVYGDWLHAAGKPTILVYGHFDVQPVDPVDLWSSPPFEPTVQDGRVYARGASDMKGSLLESILGIEAVLHTQESLPVNVKFILEGQEEIGSPQLPDFVASHRDLLACDLVLSGDGGQWSEDQPSLLVALKGGCAIQIDVYGARTDLHSGLYGGAVANPIHALVRILDSMRSPDGAITVEGFYDDVMPLSDEDRAAIAEVPFDEAAYKEGLGLEDLAGEPGYTPLERAWARPTLEVNGIWGGFEGEGVKTVIPREAHAKITCRLVPDQDPSGIRRLLVEHVERNTPTGVRATVREMPFVARPYLIPRDHWGNRVAAEVLTAIYGKEPYYIRMGGSVPVCETFLSELGAYTIGFGFSLDDEQFHAPNEFLRLQNFGRGQQAWAALIERLGQETIGAAAAS